ncbi:hypothetical protein [Streptomyces griseocarneus]|uniref:hypothetical protein n=1 Tax=Streptomyces griseocarneus TaxID=51201 RepID=UPI00167F113D|nr:hypothetical protein [Streptomyces griseocarneus]MBZ6476998.1 hypothetical protein [Streptomyces griseocarneus]GHG76244.1 hypothetical protein GCM10018779_54430 [Streptomyces griseocarneus]
MRAHLMTATAVTAVALAALGALGGSRAHAAAPGDTGPRECLDGGGAIVVTVGGTYLAPTVQKVCVGGSKDGQVLG